MFRWNFAEAILSRWAIKRVCKFILKKKLGDFILGDIDIDQLEVQLTRGTIQLSDLAINVDYINQKLAGAAVVLKEGSIASLSIKIPWKLQNCQIELDELELVLAPFTGSKIQASNSCSESSSADKQQVECHSPDKNEPGICRESYGSVSLDIHEGVKTIAKIVKWLLTSFHVRLKNLIVAFDPCLEMDQNRLPVHKSLVLRIAETEFGTCLSEDADRNHISKSDCLLGMAKLTNFVKFRGAVIEVVKMADMDKSSCTQDSLQTLCNECSSSSSPLGYTTAILTGRSEGISGRMNISIPWKNGSLDIHEVDAAVCFDPIELRLQPNTIEWIIIVWESLEYAGKAARNCAQFNMMDSSCLNSRFHSSSLRNSTMLGADVTNPSSRKVSEELPFDFNGESFFDDLIPRTHVIHDWVPLSFEEDQKELEEDYGASIDEFFECFDGLRSSQANSANSGLWNWTYSVFSAINVASNLASGSGQRLPEQHVETSLRATVAGVSLFLYFHDKEGNVSDQFFGSDRDDNKSCPLDHLRPLKSCTQNSLSSGQSLDSYASCFSSMAEPNLTGLKIDHLKANSQDVVITFQIGSRKKDCKISVKDVKIDEYYQKNHVRMFGFFDNIDLFDQMLINRSLKQKVLDALPPFPVFIQEYDLETTIERNIENISENSSSQQGLIKVGLMETSGDFSFHCVVSVADPSGSSVSSTSFSLNFPPCVLWLHFHLIDSLLNLFRMVETCFKRSVDNRDFVVENSSRDIKFSPHDVKRSDSSIKTVPRADNVQGNFVFARTRIIICFPLQNMEDFRHLYLMDKFIILEHFPPLITEEVSEVSPRPLKQLGASNGSSSTPTLSLHFDVGTLDMYFTNSIPKDAIADQSSPFKLKEVSVVKILSLTNRTGDKLSGISIVWQNGPVTGPWMTSRAWRMASTHDRRSRNKVAGKDCEFYSVAAVEDIEEMCSDIRQELILSSGFLLCLGFATIQLNLHSHDYERLSCLLDIVMQGLSSGGSSKFGVSEEERILYKHDSSQATIIMDCDILDLHIVFDEVPDCSLSVQKELIGSWNGFRLIVEKFEIMSVSNIGDISGTNFFRLIHGEGRLCGSIFNVNDCTSSATHDVLLISCTNSVSRRGGGDGSNVLSFGSAGTTITYLSNPHLSRSHTSILIHCGTIIAPGGRLDWIGHICSFFSSPFEKESSSSDVNQSKLSSNCKTYEASFFLDLVDVALCYEPHFKHDDAYVGCDDTEQFVGSLLAASSFSISNHAKSNSASSEYNIQLRDLGLLICQSSGLNNDYGSYDVNYLQKMGYAKVASACLLVAVVKIYSLRWEVKCSDSHVNFHTCHDTTHGLFRLIAQLQQLYAPDVEDALAHLQSRWNSVQQSLKTNGSDDALDNSHSSLSSDSGKELSRSDDNSQNIGLLDGIIENAFQSDNPPNPNVIGQDTVDIINPNSSFPFVDALSSVKMSACNNGTEDCCSTSNSGLDNIEIMSEREELLPPLIESYYFPETMEPSLTAKGSPPQEGQRWTYDLPARADLDCGKVEWYIDSYPVIVDNHVPNSVPLDSDQHYEKTKFVPVDSDASAHCREKGKVLFKNIDVRWSMFAGSDWSKQMKSSTGKDGGISLELILSGLNTLYAIFPEGEINVSKLSIDAQDLNLYDKSANAPWKMVIGHYNSKDHPRESYAKAFKLDLETVRPNPMTPLEDYRLYLELLPIRLHLDQSQINFLISFFRNGLSVEESPAISKDVDMSCMDEKMSKAYRNLPIVEEALLPFFQKCDVKPLVVCVDYVPRHMDLTSLRSGNYVELLNLVPWKGIDLQLKQVCAVGVYGWASLCETVVGQWLEDISHNQVHKLLKGLAPVRSLVSVAAGASKLVTLPVKSYRRDKKLVKGVQRGAIAFVKSISLEAVGLGVHLASGAHEILLQTEFILRNIPSNAPSPSDKNRRKKSANSNQPADAQEGIRQAYESLSDGFSRTARAILGTPITEYRRGASAGSALATAVRAAPAAAIAPVTASAHAMRCALLGMRNSLDPEHQKESMNKYLGSSRP
ncbi:autophagy-related protein 2 [Phalaenopsis equestris]|uniref:autophagy-related protein 2 n=1 Tax=Phalaenopsis equestris TaxID=78828 RepID=UPI0009E24CFA|nr:autophagy-related protein 2 [Phalaenopsis equestris]